MKWIFRLLSISLLMMFSAVGFSSTYVVKKEFEKCSFENVKFDNIDMVSINLDNHICFGVNYLVCGKITKFENYNSKLSKHYLNHNQKHFASKYRYGYYADINYCLHTIKKTNNTYHLELKNKLLLDTRSNC